MNNSNTVKRTTFYLLVLSAVFFIASLSFAADWSITVDDGGPGYTETGNWKSWVFPPAVGGSYRYLTREIAGVANRKGKAYWATVVPETGIYKVEVSYRLTENRTYDADFFVHDGEGNSHHFVVNQRSHDTKGYLTWKTLGNFQWKANQKALVELDGTDDTLSDEADAVRWTLVEIIQPESTLPPVLDTLLLNDK